MSLKSWAGNGWLKEHKTSKQEINNLFEFVKELKEEVINWIEKNHSDLF